MTIKENVHLACSEELSSRIETIKKAMASAEESMMNETKSSAGDKFEVAVEADNAYGERHDGFVQTVPKAMFESIEDLDVGTQLRATTDEGEQTVIVIDVTDDEITVDGNHPLAGIDLSFDVEILEVRDATEEELNHGHVHAEGGCEH